MKLTELIVRRPISAVVVMIGIIIFGITSILGMPQELTPEMNLPMLMINTVYPGAGPEDTEKLVSQKIEGAVASLSGIDTIYSVSIEGSSILQIQYEYGTNMDVAYSKVKERLDRIANSLPDDCLSPVVMEIDMNALMDTMSLSISSSSGENLLGLVEDDIVPEFSKLSTVADVSVSGGREEYIRVELMEDKLNQYGVAMSRVVDSLKTADFSIPSGYADYGSQSLAVRSSVEFRTMKALENIPIPLGSGNIIRLADVANIYRTTKDATSVSRYNGEDNIGLGIQKRQSASAVSVSRQVNKTINELNAKNAGYHIDIVHDNSESIQSSIISVAQSLILAIILSMLVLIFFLGDFKASLIIASSMPISLLVAFILMSFMGFTLNVVTMSAMVLGVGMMVDNSIVVLDACFKARGTDKTFVDSALEGTKFVLGSIGGSTVTTVVVFLPLALLKGMVGQLFTPLGYTIVFSLVASLLSAMTLVPLFFVQFQPHERQDAFGAKLLKKVEKGYGKLLKSILDRKKTAFFVSMALIAASVFLATKINMELMPASDQGIINISAETRPGLQLEKIDEIMTNIESMIAKHPDVDHFTVRFGSQSLASMMGGGGSGVTVYLKDDRAMKTDDVVEMFREETKGYLNCDVTVSSQSMTQNMSSDDITVTLTGNDLTVMKGFVAEIEDVIRQNPNILTVTSSVASPIPQAEIIVDPMKAAAVGFTPMQVASTVNMALGGASTVNLTQDGREYAIRVEYPPGKYTTVGDLSDLILTSPTGSSVPLMDISKIEFTDTPQTIMRQDSQYYVTVTATPKLAEKFTATADVNAKVAQMQFPKGVELADNAQQEMMTTEFASLGQAILIAIWLVFMVMAIQFESIKHSLMVMICIPFSMVGSVALMYLTGTTISMTSLLGFLILVGTVVNNGILFVDSANQYRKSMDVRTALVRTGRNRLRPILMTTLTTVLSMLPMAFATGSAAMMKGLGLVVIGGLTVSTILTLLLLPIFYLMIDGNEAKKLKKAEKKRIRLAAKRAEASPDDDDIPLLAEEVKS